MPVVIDRRVRGVRAKQDVGSAFVNGVDLADVGIAGVVCLDGK